MPARLGAAARALLDSGSSAYADLPWSELREGIVELVAAQAAEYLEYEMLEIDIALVRVMRLGIDRVDARLVEWLGEHPSTARLGVICRALWQLWSPVNPHPAIDPAAAQGLVTAAAVVEIGEYEIGAYRAALDFAVAQISDPGTVAALDQERARVAGDAGAR